MERKIGEVFIYNSKTYQVVKGSKCENCNIKGRVFQHLVFRSMF